MPSSSESVFEPNRKFREEDPSWRLRAACRNGVDTDLFFPERGGDADKRCSEAKEVCRRCPVRLPCLNYALVTNTREGVWGGTSPNERYALKRQGLTAADVFPNLVA